MTTHALSPSVTQSLEHLRALVEFAYAQGFHELGYDPLKTVTVECHRAQLAAVGFDPVAAHFMRMTAPGAAEAPLEAPAVVLDAGVPLGSAWQHSNGDRYVVLGHTNMYSTQPDRYPPSIVYTGTDGRVWSRPVSDWARSMTALHGSAA